MRSLHIYTLEMSLNFDPFKIIQTFDCASLLQQNFSTILELPDSIRVQGSFDLQLNIRKGE